MASASQRAQAPLSIEVTNGILDLSKSTYFYQIVSPNTTFSFINRPESVNVFQLIIHHTGGTVSWPSNVRWAGGVAPSGLQIGKVHIFTFTRPEGNGSDQWIGTYVLNS